MILGEKMVFWMASHSVEHATKLEVGKRPGEREGSDRVGYGWYLPTYLGSVREKETSEKAPGLGEEGGIYCTI